MELDHESLMRLAIAQGELARGSTGDNPWVGCVIVDNTGELLGSGYTQGPGEDHAEIAAVAVAKARGFALSGSTVYSTLEPCSFHGRTPACARVLADLRIGRLVFAMRDPHPRVDGEGANILRRGGIEISEGVCEPLVRRQLGDWVWKYHLHEPLRRAKALRAAHSAQEVIAMLAEIYAVDTAQAAALVRELDAA